MNKLFFPFLVLPLLLPVSAYSQRGEGPLLGPPATPADPGQRLLGPRQETPPEPRQPGQQKRPADQRQRGRETRETPPAQEDVPETEAAAPGRRVPAPWEQAPPAPPAASPQYPATEKTAPQEPDSANTTSFPEEENTSKGREKRKKKHYSGTVYLSTENFRTKNTLGGGIQCFLDLVAENDCRHQLRRIAVDFVWNDETTKSVSFANVNPGYNKKKQYAMFGKPCYTIRRKRSPELHVNYCKMRKIIVDPETKDVSFQTMTPDECKSFIKLKQ